MFESILSYFTGWFTVVDTNTTVRDGQRVRVTVRPSITTPIALEAAKTYFLTSSFKVNGGIVRAEEVNIENGKLIITGIFNAASPGQDASIGGWLGLAIAVTVVVGLLFNIEKVELAIEESSVLVVRITLLVIVLAIIWKFVLKR